MNSAPLTVGPFGAVSIVEMDVGIGTTLLAVGPFGASNVIDFSAVGSRATVSGPALWAIVNVVVDAGVINRLEGAWFCRRCGLRTAAEMYRGMNKMDSRYILAILKDKAFMIEEIFAEGVVE